MTGSFTQGIKTVLHPVSDRRRPRRYAALGVPAQTDGSHYVGFEAAGQHIGLVPGGGPQNYHEVTWRLEKRKNSTALTVSERNLPSDEAKAISNQGWATELPALRRCWRARTPERA